LPTEQKANGIRTVSEVVKPYLASYGLNHRPQSVLFAKGRLAQVERLLGGVLLSDLTEERIKSYIRQRQGDEVSGRTINMELGELSRAMRETWRILWPRVRKLEERKDVGRALSPEQQENLLAGLEARHTPHLQTLIPLLLLTGMRSGEAFSLTWTQIDLMDKTITVGRAKTSNGTGRTIPINDDLARILVAHRQWFVDRFGQPRPDHYLFPWGKPLPSDPSRHVTDISWGWDQLRKNTGVSCRLHDLRHTFATRLAENGVSESTMLAPMGHMSRAMLERYSHIRMAAKREAIARVTLATVKHELEGVPVKVPVPAAAAVLQ
jgi:integrase